MPVKVLAVIPARGGSKGLPDKNIRLLAGLPLIVHSIRLAQLCPVIDRTIVSTDSQKIVKVAREAGADVPFLRPAELAQDDTPMWPVLRHALQAVEEIDHRRYDYLVLLDPTSPGRLPRDVAEALEQLKSTPEADGIVGVSQPEFNPIWHCVIERDGWMTNLIPEGLRFTRRQDLPLVYRVNATLYIWRADFIRRVRDSWREQGKHLIYEVPEVQAIHIDDIDEFRRADLFLGAGLIKLPWLHKGDM